MSVNTKVTVPCGRSARGVHDLEALRLLRVVAQRLPGWAARRLDQLDQDAVARAWMDERDRALGTSARRLVDQLDSVCRQPVELRGDVVDLEADVMEPLPARLEEAGDARCRVRWARPARCSIRRPAERRSARRRPRLAGGRRAAGPVDRGRPREPRPCRAPRLPRGERWLAPLTKPNACSITSIACGLSTAG